MRHWMLSLNLPEQYVALLLGAGYDTLTKCERLNDVVLEQIGIKPVGHRRRILFHLPRAETEAESFTSASPDSEEDDREIYDIPPVARKSGIMLPQETTYTNIVEMNEIPRPILPPKKRLSSDVEVDAKLGIISPPVKPRLSQGVFGISPCSPDSARTKPKLCVVYPEKRPPVPARRISKEGKALSTMVVNPLNNEIEGFDPAVVQKAPISEPVAPVAMPRPFLKHRDTICEEDSKPDPVMVADHKFSEPRATAVASVGPVLRQDSVDVAPKPSSCCDAGSADNVLQANKLNPGLEHELQELVSAAKRPVLRKVDAGTETASDSCSTDAGDSVLHSAAVQPKSAVPAFSIPSNSISTDRTVPVSSLMSFESFESNDLHNLTAVVEQTTSRNADAEASNIHHDSDLNCVFVVTNEGDNTDSLSQPSSHLNQEPTVKDLGLREKVEQCDNLVYEGLDEMALDEQDVDRKDSSECQYSPPSFPPPPLPDDFEPYGVFELSTYAESIANNWEPSSRTSKNERTPSVKPEPPPRRRKSTDDVVDDTGMALSPLVAGFSSALDDYLSQKVTSPSSWLDQPLGSQSAVRNVSNSEFEPFADLQSPEPSPETSKGISPQNQSLVSLDSNGDYVPTDETSILYEFEKTADDSSKSKKTKSFYESAPGVVKSLTADDFKEVPCNIETGNRMKSLIFVVVVIVCVTEGCHFYFSF